MENGWKVQTQDQKKAKKLKIYISGGLALAGIVVIASQLVPLGLSYIDGIVEQRRTDIKVQPVPESYQKYIAEEFAYYDPGKSYFANLSQQLGNFDANNQYTYDPVTNTQKAIVIDKEYKKEMRISIESIGIKDIKISSNVDSYDEKVYNQFLKQGLAHFKGTPLPGAGGNSFIYGHSAVTSFFKNHSNLPETIFSRLNDIDTGQKVLITKDGEVLEYTVRSKKLVSPEDFSILQPINDKETITMMTCWPLGIGTKRLVVIAERKI